MDNNKKQNINDLASNYFLKKCDESFEDLYRSIKEEFKNKLNWWSGSTFMANDHDFESLFDDTLLKTLKVIETDGGDFVKLFTRALHNNYKSFLRKLRTRRKYEIYEDNNNEDDGNELDHISFYTETNIEIGETKEADQLALIDSLLKDADELTIGVVKTFLKHPKPTPTAIGKSLGLHHSTVIRKLEKLASKFDSKQYGSHRDYLVAL